MKDSLELRVAMAKRQSEIGFGRARLDSISRRSLALELGDVIEILGKKTAVAKVFKGDLEDEGKNIIRIDGPTRTSAGIGVDDKVKIRKCVPMPAISIKLCPIMSDGKQFDFDEEMEKVFRLNLLGRPIIIGLDLLIPNIALMGNRSTFRVTAANPSGPIVISPETRISIGTEPESKISNNFSKKFTYDDIGGLDDELKKVREMIELPLKHPELFDRMGISAPKGVLLYGPPGTGKTLIAEALASESGASFYSVNGPEIMGQFHGQSEERLRIVFETAAKNSPSIIFLDEIDSIAPNRDSVQGDVERRVVAQLLTLMDGLGSSRDIVVIGATNRESSIDPALRRPGRFDREIEIGIPGSDGRRDILAVHLRNMPITEDVDVERLVGMTYGFVGADLAALAREAAMRCLSRHLQELDLNNPIPQENLESMKITMDDFTEALTDIEPSGMRELSVEIPKVSWDEIGGVDEIRKELNEIFIPSDGKRAFDRLGIKSGNGVLLYGPPGTGKSLIAKAVANHSNANFIKIDGPEIASKWLGESEAEIRKIFKRAKQLAPSIIFFDEIDSIAPRRGDGTNQTWERVVAQILTAMDGISGLDNVLVMAATNRPDIIDPALLRPGRMDRHILVGRPNKNDRLKILKIHTKNMPLNCVNLEEIASSTEGYVGADLESVCREAGLAAYRENADADKVDMKHFHMALNKISASVDEDTFKNYEAIGGEIRKRKGSWSDLPFYG